MIVTVMLMITIDRVVVSHERRPLSSPSIMMMAGEATVSEIMAAVPRPPPSPHSSDKFDPLQVSPKTTKRIELAKAFVDSDGGLTKPDLLADDFSFVGE